MLANLSFIVIATVLVLGLQPSHRADDVPTAVAAPSIDNFEVDHVLAHDAIRKLAVDQHIVIGISGTLVGSDDKLIVIKLSKTSVKGVLDAIVAADSRYSWAITSSGAIRVTLGMGLDLISVRLHEWKINKLPRAMIASQLEATPAIGKWLRLNTCSLYEISMFVAGDNIAVSVSISDQTVAELLDEIAVETRSYSWFVLKFSENPCAINLTP